MSWRTVVITKRAKLDLEIGYMVIRSTDTIKIHLGELSTVIVESTAVSLTAALLCELIKRKVKVIFCDEKRNPSSELIAYYGSHDTAIKVRNQVAWKQQFKDLIWTEIVSEKIRKQKEFLELLGCDEEAELLNSYIEEIAIRDASNREGHAAKVYFNALFGMDFTRSTDNSINAALNYGYSLVLSAFNREITANGYVTQLGIFHDNMFNPFNLGSDLMEPFRVLVDRKVRSMWPSKFEHDEKIVMLDVLNQEVYIDGRTQIVNNAIKIYCKSVLDALSEGDISLIKFYNL